MKAVLWWEEAVGMQRMKPSDPTERGYFQTCGFAVQEQSQLACSLWPSGGQKSGISETKIPILVNMIRYEPFQYYFVLE